MLKRRQNHCRTQADLLIDFESLVSNRSSQFNALKLFLVLLDLVRNKICWTFLWIKQGSSSLISGKVIFEFGNLNLIQSSVGRKSIRRIWTSVQAYSCNENLKYPESKSLNNQIGKLDQDKNLMESCYWIRQSPVDLDACNVGCNSILRIRIFLSKPIPAMKTEQNGSQNLWIKKEKLFQRQ